MTFPITRTPIAMLLYVRTPAVPPYNAIEVLRARTPEGPYEPLTDTVAKKAELVVGNEGPYMLHDTVLSLELPSGAVLDYMFTGTNPLDPATAAAELNVASAELDCTTSGNKLVLRTLATGTGAVLRVIGGDACWWLGIVDSTVVFGRAARLAMTPTAHIYSFGELNGSFEYEYRYQLIATVPPMVTEMMRPVAIGRDITLALDDITVGYIKVTELSGVSSDRFVHVANRLIPPATGDTLIVGDQVKQLDTSGEAQFVLVRGSKIEFYVPGSPLHRVITVPDVDSFDMMDPSLVADDAWGIVVPPYTSLPRTT